MSNELTRRKFIEALALLAVSMPLRAGSPRALIPGRPRNPVLVSVFLRGGADFMSLVVPHQERNYYRSRGSLAVAAPGREGGAIDVGSGFGFHPALSELAGWYRKGRLAVLHAVGRDDPSRSHFEEQDVWDTASPEDSASSDGWINRHLALVKPHGTVRAICLGDGLVRSMRGRMSVQSVSDLAEVSLKGGFVQQEPARELLRELHGSTAEGDLAAAGASALQAMDTLRQVHETRTPPAHGADYPNGAFARRMRQAAQLIKADIGIEVISCDLEGWDTHFWQGNLVGALPNNARLLSKTLHAFATDLGNDLDRVVVLITTEFGRTLLQNGTGGTDHGRACGAFLLGGKVRGGRLHGRWPGLEVHQLHQGREQDWTTEFRSLLAHVIRHHLANPRAGEIFPRFRPTALSLLPA